MNKPTSRPYMTPAQVQDMLRDQRSTPPETRMIRLELQHACAAIERAWLLSKGSEVEADIVRLLEAGQATLMLVKEDTNLGR